MTACTISDAHKYRQTCLHFVGVFPGPIYYSLNVFKLLFYATGSHQQQPYKDSSVAESTVHTELRCYFHRWCCNGIAQTITATHAGSVYSNSLCTITTVTTSLCSYDV